MRVSIDARLILLLLVVLACTGARRHKLIDPIEWDELAVDTFPPVADILGGTAPVFVVAGETVPHDGWLLAGTGYPQFGAQYMAQGVALDTCNRGRRGDRWDADGMLESVIEGLKTCRAAHPRTFAAGCGVCFGGAAAAGWAIEAGRP